MSSLAVVSRIRRPRRSVMPSALTLSGPWAISGRLPMPVRMSQCSWMFASSYLPPAAFAHDHRLQFFQLDEIVGLAPQFVGDHRRLRADGRADRHPPAFALHRLIGNGDDVPANLRAYAETQWSRASVRGYVDQPRAPFVPYSY